MDIKSYIHCSKCFKDMPDGKSPQTWAMLDIGFTDIGIQVWCRRHNSNVMHIDFQGHRHPADLLGGN